MNYRILLAALALLAGPVVSSAVEVPEELSTSDWSSIREAYEAGRHAVRLGDDGRHTARNPGQQWNTDFDGRGFLVTPQHGKWTWGMDLQSVGATEMTGAPRVRAADNRLSYHWNDQVEEWFVNDQRGLEQGWTIADREGVLADDGIPLSLSFRIRGGLRPVVSSDGKGVSFWQDQGSALNYGGLKAWDAEGEALGVRFLRGEEGEALQIEVDDKGATYPIMIDPVAQQAYLKATNADSNDDFGWAVAVSGDTVVVGAPDEDGDSTSTASTPNENASKAGAAYVFVRSGQTWIQEAYLKASNAGGGDLFGQSVAIHGDTIVVGAWHEGGDASSTEFTPNDNLLFAGAAYVFVRNGTNWSQEAYLKASNAGPSDEFGYSVAVDGDTVVVGARSEDGNASSTTGSPNDLAPSAGAAYVFVRSGTSWSEEDYLKASNAESQDQFGCAVSLQGDTVLVGALLESGDASSTAASPNNNASESGAVYVFTRSGTNWIQEAYLKASNTVSSDRFGFSVCLSGDTAIVGAPIKDSAAGAAYIFTRSGTNWSEEEYLQATNAQGNDRFGSSVGLSGDTAVVGAWLEDGDQNSTVSVPNESAPSAGAVYVYERSGTSWSEEDYLKAVNTGSSDFFGYSVAIDGSTVVIGAYGEDGDASSTGTAPNENESSAGAAYVVELVALPENQPPTAVATYAVLDAASGQMRLDGSGSSDPDGTIVNYVWTWSGGSTLGETATVNLPAGDTLVTLTVTDDRGGADDASFTVSSAGSLAGTVPEFLQNEIPAPPTGTQSGQLGWSLATSGDWVAMSAPWADISAGNSGEVKVFSASTGCLVHVIPNPDTDPGTDEFFGGRNNTVAISGNLLAVGESRNNGSGVDRSGSVFVYDLAGPTPTVPKWTLDNPTPDTDDSFGAAVDISGSIVAVGAYEDDSSGPNDGAAYFYDLSGPTPEVPILSLMDASFESSFGWRVALNGRRAVVSCYFGPAYVFDLDSPTPTVPIAILEETLGDANFGYKVRFSGDWVAISSVGNNISGEIVYGRVDIYDLGSASPGSPVLTINDPAPEPGAFFGEDVSISGSRVAVGARGFSTGGILYPGVVYVYDLDVATPSIPQLMVQSPNPGINDYFGAAVLLTEDRLIATAPQGGSPLFTGSGYVYDLAGGTPTVPIREIAHASPSRGDNFGESCAIAGDTLLIGSPGASRVTVFDLGSTSPAEAAYELQRPGTTAEDFSAFGSSVSISGNIAVAGARFDDSTGVNSGATYVYDLEGASPGLPILTIPSPSAGTDSFGGAVAVSGRLIVIGARYHDAGSSDAGIAYVYNLDAATPATPIAVLDNPNPTSNAYFGEAVAISGNHVVVGARGATRTYVYDLSSSTPDTPVWTLSNPDSGQTGSFGGAVSISGSRISVGAYNQNAGDGAVFVYDLLDATPEIPVETLANPDPGSESRYGRAVSLVAGRLVVGASSSDYPEADFAGTAYFYDLDGPSPTAPAATFSNPSPGRTDYFGGAVATDGVRVLVGAENDSTIAYQKGGAYLYAPARPAPEIVIEQPIGTEMTSGLSSHFFGEVAVGAGMPRTFRIRNTGQVGLSVGGASLSGGNDADFSIVAPPSGAISTSGYSDLTVAFTPSATGIRTTTLKIINDDPNGNEAPFRITLVGSGITATDLLASEINAAGLSGDDALFAATPYDDGVSNLLKYAFNMNLAGPDGSSMTSGGSSGLPGGELIEEGGQTYWRVEFVERIGSGLTYTPKKSTTLAPGSFVPLTATPQIESIDGEWRRVIYDEPCNPGNTPRCFSHVEVELP